MALLTGSLLNFGSPPPQWERWHAEVFVLFGDQTIATTATNAEGQFSVELPDDLRGKLEVRCDLTYTAPTTVVATGDDLEVAIVVNRAAGHN